MALVLWSRLLCKVFDVLCVLSTCASPVPQHVEMWCVVCFPCPTRLAHRAGALPLESTSNVFPVLTQPREGGDLQVSPNGPTKAEHGRLAT